MTKHDMPKLIGSDEADRVFETVGGSIWGLLSELGQIKDETAFVATLVGPEGHRELLAQNEAIKGFLGEVREDVAQLSDQMNMLDSNAKELRLLLATQASDLRLAAMVATNARVVSSTIADEDGSLAQFAEDAQSLMNEAATRIGDLQKSLMSADAQLKVSEGTIRGFNDDVRILLRRGAQLPAMIAALPTQTLDQTAIQSSRSLSTVEKALEAATGHLQAGDAVRQRLEHADEIAKKSAYEGGAAKQAVLALADAQKVGAINALADAAASLMPELTRMSDTWSTTSHRLGGLTDPAISEKLTDLTRLLEDIVEGSNTLMALRSRIAEELAALVQKYGEVIPHLHSAIELDRDMGLLSINTILASGRLGDNGKALMEVSRQLRETTAQTGRQGHRIAELSRSQETIINDITASDFDMSDETYQTALSGILDKMNRLTRSLAKIDRASSTWTTKPPLDGIVRSLSGLVAQRLDDATSTARIRSLMTQDASVAVALSGTEAVYTMQAERDLHNALTGQSTAESTPDNVVNLDVFF